MVNLKEKEALLGKAYREMGDINVSLSEEGLQTDLKDLDEYENFLREQ